MLASTSSFFRFSSHMPWSILSSSDDKKAVEAALHELANSNDTPTEDVAKYFVAISRWLELHDERIEIQAARLLLRRCKDSIVLHSEVSCSFTERIREFEGDLTLRFQTLTPDLARTIVSMQCRVLRLGGFQKISESAAAVLSEFNGSLFLDDLVGLTDSMVDRRLFRKICQSKKDIVLKFKNLTEYQAQHLGSHLGEVTLNHLENMPDSPGHIALAKKNVFRIGRLNLKEVGDHVAAEIAAYKANVELRFLEHLNSSPGHLALARKVVNLEERIGERKHELVFLNLQSLALEAARILSHFQGRLELNGPQFSDDTIGELSKHQGDLSIGVESLRTLAAEKLARHQGGALEIRCTSLSDNVIESLGRRDGRLILCIDELTESGAFSLSNHTTGVLQIEAQRVSKSAIHYLRGRCGELILKVDTLDDSSAETLSNYFGVSLQLEVRTALSDVALIALSQYQGRLTFLHGIKLSDNAAASLGNHCGLLEFKDLRELSDAAAISLCKKSANLKLGVCSFSSSAWKVFKENGVVSGDDLFSKPQESHNSRVMNRVYRQSFGWDD
ncbi:hypothetical protein N9Y42_03155 [Mariniblastus sp.]|nr:hypothetical protein [Mariniblastus sp.]